MGLSPVPLQIAVGPIHLGESVADIEKTLGKGWSGLDCEDEENGDGSKCAHVLANTDGVDQLKLYVEGNTVFLVEARENRAEGARLKGRPPLRGWHWAGGTLFEMPPQLAGWTAKKWRPDHDRGWTMSYDYGHGFSVWFTQNKWGGVDLHMFED